MERIDEPTHALIPIGGVLAVIVGLILVQPDLGTAVSIVMIVAVMIFAAGINYRYVFGLALVAAGTSRLLDLDIGLPVEAHHRLPRSRGRIRSVMAFR